MVEIVEFEVFAQEAKIAEEMMVLRNKEEKKKPRKYDKHRLRKKDKILLAKLMVWAAFNKDEDKITKFTDFIYKRLFGDSWYEDEVWMDQPINWLDLDLIRWVNGEDFCGDEPVTYEELFEHAYSLIDELCKNRNQIKKDKQ